MTARYRVLVIDDDQMFRSLIQTILRKDFFVSVAAHGQEGYLKAKEHRPDVAVIDVQMPGWSGIDTLRAFHNDPQLRDVKIIMLTADASKETVLAAVHSGADDYVIKSCFNKKEFIYKIHRQILGAAAAAELCDAEFDPSSTNKTAGSDSGRHAGDSELNMKSRDSHYLSRKDAVTVTSSGSAVQSDHVQAIVDSWE